MFALVPDWYIGLVIVLLGAIVGSFLNVVIYRLHTGRSLNGRSHCLSCGQALRWFELVPVLSYIFLRGRCARCGSHIPPRYVLVEVLTASLFWLVWWTSDALLEVPPLLVVTALLVVIGVYDWNHYIIPDSLVAALTVVTVSWLGWQWYVSGDGYRLLYDVLAAAAAASFLGSLWFLSRGRALGFGDVKLVIPLALLVGHAAVFSFVVVSFWVGALLSVGALVYVRYQHRGQPGLHSRGRALTMKSAVPFGPFLIAGFFLTYLFKIDVLLLFALYAT